MPSDLRFLRSGSDVRGDACEFNGRPITLTPEIVAQIAYTFALWLARKLDTTSDRLIIAVGRDPRITGEALSAAVVRGLTAADCDVLDCALMTTPAMFYTTVDEATCAHGALMITASHHPWYRNGLKFMTGQGGLTALEVTALLDEAQHVTLPRRLVRDVDYLSVYSDRLARLVRDQLDAEDDELPLLGLHVVVDAGNGSGGFYANLMQSLGADTTGSQFLDPNGMFPNHTPNPESPEAMRSVSRAVVEAKADLGVIFDCDCDRAALVDATGREINRNRLIALISAILLEEKPGITIVTDSVTSSGLQQFIGEWGGVHYRFKRGYRNVIDEAMRLNDEGIDCPIAIETSGHAALRENYFLDDGMYLVTRLIIEAVRRKRRGQTLGSLITELREPVESLELRMQLSGPDFHAAGQAAIDRVLAAECDFWYPAADNREGVRMVCGLEGGMDNAWFLLRLSLHDPVMPLNVESDIPGGVKLMLATLLNILKGSEGLDLSLIEEALAN